MDQPKKRRRIRDPLTLEQELAGESNWWILKVDDILQLFQARPDLDKTDFREQLEYMVTWFVDFSAIEGDVPASRREESLKRLAQQINGILLALQSTPLEFIGAAHNIARRMGSLPDFECDFVTLEPRKGNTRSGPSDMAVWPVEEQIGKALDELTWLWYLVLEAKRRAAAAKGGRGKRPDEARHLFFRSATRLYEQSARCPAEPYKDRISHEPQGELIDFLDACLRLGGVRSTRASIYSLYRRTIGRLSGSTPLISQIKK